ncbi:MAG TPA: SMC family ATPase [Streptosporangiaceae bacterium]
MRPISLDMNGFASFRTQTRVDFTDADFFVLVGPTGSGKSTVIDAMTFALYGSVPRWDRKGMVSLALAPTTARGTVKLVFEAGDQRYVAVRELRRMGSKVGQRAATLERILPPGGLAEPGEPTEVLAKDPAGVTEAVTRLLGLSYDEFCQCVVLPQGKFAAFLHAQAGDRRDILLRLLGAEHFRQMMVLANQRASAAAQSAATLDETLATLADATPAAVSAAQATEAALAALGSRVAQALPGIQTAHQELATAEQDLARLDRERAALVCVRVPAEAAALDADLAASLASLEQARDAESAAQDADTEARQALAGCPQRAPLELIQQRRDEQAQRAARLPSARDHAAQAAGLSSQASSAVTAAGAALEELRAQRDSAAREADLAGQTVRTLEAEHAALAAVIVPAGVGELDERVRTAGEALLGVRQDLDTAEAAERAARAAVDAAPAIGPLEQTARDLTELRSLDADLLACLAKRAAARTGSQAAEAELAAAAAARRDRQRELDEARRAHVAADLRPHLVAGEPCPVCDQPVAALPGPLAAAGLNEAEAGLDKAIAAVDTAQAAVRDAAATLTAADSEVASLDRERTRRIGSVDQALAGPLSRANLTAVADLIGQERGGNPARDALTSSASAEANVVAVATSTKEGRRCHNHDIACGTGGRSGTAGSGAGAGRVQGGRVEAALAQVHAVLEARVGLERELRVAVAAVSMVRDRVRAAQETLAAAEGDTAAAWGGVRAARDPLVALGAPSADDEGGRGLAAAWAGLAGWASGQADARAADLAEARHRAQEDAGRLALAQAGFGEAEHNLARLREEATRATRTQQDAQTRLAELTERLAELDRLLDGAPDEAEVIRQLARRDALEKAAEEAEAALLSARSDRGRAERVIAGLQRAEAIARGQLSAARDPLVALGAPALDGGSLLGAWTALADWARVEAVDRERHIPDVRGSIAAARSQAERLAAELVAELAASGVDLPAVGAEPTAGGTGPATDGTEPTATGTGPATDGTRPATDGTEPAAGGIEPPTGGTGPATGGTGLDPAAVVAGAASAVAAAAERARATTTRLVERRAQAGELAARRDAAREKQQVAKLLGDLLRTNRFPGWLLTAAVDTLVEYASKNLAELSGGQYDLTHEDGEFYVIDHADADSRRSVRTLSGGETFQASLALALALSTQMSALTASGATRLDSIFLDEGFGTLDPDSLDMVAGTLETLAQGQRMVGVITHVAELAERVPVRFRVSRDTLTSTVIREGLT